MGLGCGSPSGLEELLGGMLVVFRLDANDAINSGAVEGLGCGAPSGGLEELLEGTPVFCCLDVSDSLNCPDDISGVCCGSCTEPMEADMCGCDCVEGRPEGLPAGFGADADDFPDGNEVEGRFEDV